MISIMINTYNRSQILIDNIKSLQPIWNKAEIVVVDDCSTDGTEVAIRKFRGKNKINMKYIRNARNQGYARSLNIGIKGCSNDFVFILNDDNMLLEPESSIGILEKYESQSRIIGTNLVMEVAHSLVKRCTTFLYRMPAQLFAGELYNYNGSKRRFVNYCNNAFGFNRNIGILFDNKSFIKNVFRIESDFQKRARNKGIKIVYEPEVKILDRWTQFGGLREKKTNFLLYCISNHITFLRKNCRISKYWKIPFYFMLKTATHPNLTSQIIGAFNSSFKNPLANIDT